jgi:LDH2 family malate/lactate/ureidoglycolate dehydrogenase
MYINDLHKNACDGKILPKILKETPSTAWVDGQNGLGAVVGNFCMDLAIEKAKNVGVGWVVAKSNSNSLLIFGIIEEFYSQILIIGSNHYGIAGWYTIRAMNQGLIGLSMTNTSPLMCPTRSIEAGLGTNPISFSAPGTREDSFTLDMATTAVAVGKIEMQKRKELPIPLGWAQDSNGRMTTDASTAFDAACLMFDLAKNCFI